MRGGRAAGGSGGRVQEGQEKEEANTTQWGGICSRQIYLLNLNIVPSGGKEDAIRAKDKASNKGRNDPVQMFKFDPNIVKDAASPWLAVWTSSASKI